jgi:glycerol-3-phosphate cytidylyltransferase-like family protein
VRREKPDIICLGYDQTDLRDALKAAIKNFGWPIKIVNVRVFKEKELRSNLSRAKKPPLRPKSGSANL